MGESTVATSISRGSTLGTMRKNRDGAWPVSGNAHFTAAAVDKGADGQ